MHFDLYARKLLSARRRSPGIIATHRNRAKQMTQHAYIAYLLRLWREREDAAWRATLENPHSGERHGFADLEGLFSFLAGATDECHAAGVTEAKRSIVDPAD